MFSNFQCIDIFLYSLGSKIPLKISSDFNSLLSLEKGSMNESKDIGLRSTQSDGDPQIEANGLTVPV